MEVAEFAVQILHLVNLKGFYMVESLKIQRLLIQTFPQQQRQILVLTKPLAFKTIKQTLHNQLLNLTFNLSLNHNQSRLLPLNLMELSMTFAHSMHLQIVEDLSTGRVLMTHLFAVKLASLN